MAKTPYPFQEQAINVGLDTNLFLNDECGCGKKITMLEVARRIREVYNLPTLVVTVKRDTLQWKREILGQDPTIPVVIGTSDVLWVPEVRDWWLVVHYEALVRHIKGLRKVKFGTVILDESHYIKNWQAQRSKAAKQLKALRKVAGTGTPMDKSPGDIWSQLEFLYPETYRGTRRKFLETHERSYRDLGGYKHVLPGVVNPMVLSSELAPFTFARTKLDVAPELPPNIEKVVHIQLTGTQASLYRRIQNAADIIIEGPELPTPMMISTVLAQMVKEQQAALDPALLGSMAESAKFEWLRDWIDGNPQEQVIIFTNYRVTAEYLARTYHANLIMGGVVLPTKWDKRVIVATIKAASEALDLGFIPTAIFMDENNSQLRMRQAISRIHRLGNTSPSETIYLHAVDTIDEIIHQAWTEKWDRYQLLRAFTTWRHGGVEPPPTVVR